MKTILHVDMNAYFASVEQAANPHLRGKPIAVGGGVGGKRTIVAAASYEAKARGVKTAMPAWEAKKICPELIMVSGDMNKYIYTSTEIIKILRKYTDLVEVFSIDEAFMDVTGTRERFGGEVAIAKKIKQTIRERFKLTCSIGIGPNKFLAKLAGELKKPDGLMRLDHQDIPERIKDIPVSKLCGVGRKLEKYLGELGIKTFGNLNRHPRDRLVRRFGVVCGEQLYSMGQGLDSSRVLPYTHTEDAKSMGHSYTLPKNTGNSDEVKGYLLRLSEQVGRRLRRDNYKGSVVHLSLGFGNFRFWGKQRKLEDYINDGYEIFKIAERMLDPLCPLSGHLPLTKGEKERGLIRFIGVSVSNLLHNLDQVSLFENKEQHKKLLKAVDMINDRYGEFTIERLALLNTVLEGKVGMVNPSAYK